MLYIPYRPLSRGSKACYSVKDQNTLGIRCGGDPQGNNYPRREEIISYLIIPPERVELDPHTIIEEIHDLNRNDEETVFTHMHLGYELNVSSRIQFKWIRFKVRIGNQDFIEDNSCSIVSRFPRIIAEKEVFEGQFKITGKGLIDRERTNTDLQTSSSVCYLPKIASFQYDRRTVYWDFVPVMNEAFGGCNSLSLLVRSKEGCSLSAMVDLYIRAETGHQEELYAKAPQQIFNP